MLGVHSSIIVLSVRVSTVQQTVPFVAQLSPFRGRPLAAISQLPTPVKSDRLLALLKDYNPSDIEFLRTGFSAGFRLHFEGSRQNFEAKNLKSALENPKAVDLKLKKELEARRVAGPFACTPFQPFRVSPLGIVPKKIPNEFRLIHHLSYPNGFSVNDGIASEHSSVSYSTTDDAITLIKQAGRGSFMAKTDIKNAFRLLPIHPDDYGLLGMKWKGLYYYDKCMPMGCSSSCLTFEKFSTAVEWIAKQRLKIDHILHLLDDFLMAALSKELCQFYLDLFLKLCSYLGIPIAPGKTIGPATTICFAGIDSISMEARLPLEKVEKCRTLLLGFLTRKKVTLKEIQSLTGVLNFACSVVKPGRAFLRRLIDLTIGIKSPPFYPSY